MVWSQDRVLVMAEVYFYYSITVFYLWLSIFYIILVTCLLCDNLFINYIIL